MVASGTKTLLSLLSTQKTYLSLYFWLKYFSRQILLAKTKLTDSYGEEVLKDEGVHLGVFDSGSQLAESQRQLAGMSGGTATTTDIPNGKPTDKWSKDLAELVGFGKFYCLWSWNIVNNNVGMGTKICFHEASHGIFVWDLWQKNRTKGFRYMPKFYWACQKLNTDWGHRPSRGWSGQIGSRVDWTASTLSVRKGKKHLLFFRSWCPLDSPISSLFHTCSLNVRHLWTENKGGRRVATLKNFWNNAVTQKRGIKTSRILGPSQVQTWKGEFQLWVSIENVSRRIGCKSPDLTAESKFRNLFWSRPLHHGIFVSQECLPVCTDKIGPKATKIDEHFLPWRQKKVGTKCLPDEEIYTSPWLWLFLLIVKQQALFLGKSFSFQVCFTASARTMPTTELVLSARTGMKLRYSSRLL